MCNTDETLFQQMVAPYLGPASLCSHSLQIVQVNVGLQCNLECHHCHLGASPRRTEQMTWSTMEQVLRLVARSGCRLVDLTGGAPERNPHLRRFIRVLREQHVAVQVRTNLTVLLETDLANMAEFFHAQQVTLVASLPCYLEQNVDAQRGKGVFAQAIVALRKLNALGYGIKPESILNLVYNPGLAQLPPQQTRLEAAYRQALRQHGVEFTHLFTIANMPVGRFRADLRRQQQESAYWTLLQHAFNPDTLADLMCRYQVSVGWDGRLYDCDFNLALSFPVAVPGVDHVAQCEPAALAHRHIATGNHCLACTAGQGSSCGGALAA